VNAASCPVNIGPRGIARRRTAGWIALAFGVLAVAALMFFGYPANFRILAFGPFFVGALGVFQAQAKTCVRFERTGARDLDDGRGAVAITDEAELDTLARQARSVFVKSYALAIALTAIAWFLPARGE